jgi:hypothetical protein
MNKYTIILSKGSIKEPWTTLTDLCNTHGFKIHVLKSKKFPFEYRGYLFEKKENNTKTI